LSVIFGKTLNGINTLNGGWDLCIGQYDEYIRIEIMGKWIDIPLPSIWETKLT